MQKVQAVQQDINQGMKISGEQRACYKKIYQNKLYLNGSTFDKSSLLAYLTKKDDMSDSLKTKMTNAWKWDGAVTFEQFTAFMCVNYRFEYDGLSYDPDFGKIVRMLDQE